MSINVRSEILAAIAKTDSTETKAVLLLMLGVLEEIGGKIDNFLQDEKKLRETVLNGHEPAHHSHHDHVAKCVELGGLEVCKWARQQMADEDESEKTRKNVVQKFFEGAAGHMGSMLAGGLLMWFAFNFLK